MSEVDARSDAVFDTDTFDEDDSVYQAIRLSQKSATKES